VPQATIFELFHERNALLPATWETLTKSFEKKAKMWDKQVMSFGVIRDHLIQLR